MTSRQGINRSVDNNDWAGERPLRSVDEVLNEFEVWSKYYVSLASWCGLTYMSDSMEIYMLGFLSACAGTDLGFTTAQQSALISIVFVGEVIGGLVFAIAADVKGRRQSGIISGGILGVFSLLSGMAQSFGFLALTRFFVGFGIGGSVLPLNTLLELVPAKQRGTPINMGQIVWACGGMLTVLLAWGLLGDEDGDGGDWRILTIVVSFLPLLAFVGLYLYMPESPRWLLLEGKWQKAEAIIETIAKTNNVTLEPYTFARAGLLDEEPDSLSESGSVQSFRNKLIREEHPQYQHVNSSAGLEARQRSGNEEGEEREVVIEDGGHFAAKYTDSTYQFIIVLVNHIKDFFGKIVEIFTIPELRYTSVIITLLWVISAGNYFGSVLYMDRLFGIETDNTVCSFEYSSLLLGSTAELIGGLITLPIIDYVGRITSLAFSSVFAIIGCIMMMTGATDSGLEEAGVWTMRVAIVASANVLYATSLEHFPTKYRITAGATVYLFSRISAVVATLFVTNNSFSDLFVQGTFCGAMVVQLALVFCLKETRGQPLDTDF